MIVIEYIKLAGILVLGVLASISDIRNGIVRNRDLLIFFTGAVLIDIVSYGFLARDLLIVFLINAGIIIVIGLVLFFAHAFAGGDTKLFIVFGLLYPASMYLTYNASYVTLVFALLFALGLGYAYLLVVALLRLLKRDNRLGWLNVKNFLVNFFKNYLAAFIYVTGLNLILMWLGSRFFNIPTWVNWILCIVLALIVSRVKLLKKIYFLAGMAAIDIVLSFLFKVVPVSVNPKTYLFTLMIVLCQMMIRTNLYEEMPIDDIKAGMILTTMASMSMQGSRIKGLPEISKEDLRDRLTNEQAASVRKWGKSVNVESLYIVRKTPFAIFILLGFVCYFIIWRIVA